MELTYEKNDSAQKFVICCDCGRKMVRCNSEEVAKLTEPVVGECTICNTKAIYRGLLLTDANNINDEKFTPVNTSPQRAIRVKVNKTDSTKISCEPKEITSDNCKDVADKHYTEDKAIEMGFIDSSGYPRGNGNRPPTNKAIRLAIRFAIYGNKEGLLNNLLRDFSDDIEKGARYFDKQLKNDLKEKTGLDLDK